MRHLPSLHFPVVALAGAIIGLGVWYALALLNALWVMVIVALALSVVLELALRLSRSVFDRFGGSGDEDGDVHLPALRRKERYVAAGGLLVGLFCGFLIWGPILIWRGGLGT